MSDGDYWWTDGLGGDAHEKDADKALGLAGSGQRSAEERFLFELDKNMSELSELVVWYGMEEKDKQKEEKVNIISGFPCIRQESQAVQSSLGNTSKISCAANVSPMPTYSTVIQSTIFTKQQACSVAKALPHPHPTQAHRRWRNWWRT